MPITLSESAAKEVKSLIKDQGLPEESTRVVVEHPGLDVDLVAQREPDAAGREHREDPPEREHGCAA